MNIILEVLFSFNLVINTNSSETKFTDYATAFSNLELPLVKSEGSESRKEKHNRHKAHKRKNVRLDNAKQRVCQAIIKPEFESHLDAGNCIMREILILEAIS